MTKHPPVRIELDVWAVMRYRPDQPAAIIQRITDQRQVAQFLVLTWHPEPYRRRLIAMFDTLEQADRSVLWESTGVRTGREQHRPSEGLAYVPQSIVDGAPLVEVPG